MNNVLHMSNVRKTFGSVVALDNVSLEIATNEIHGLLGGNGAGKTTLMNVLYGLYKPDAGHIELAGQTVEIASPRDAIELGIGMVHQHFLQIDSFSVAQNIVLGTSIKNRPTMDLSQAEQRIGTLADRFGLRVNPRANLDTLSMGARQRVEILKALYRGARILILDEPTTNLTPQEVDSLFESLRVMVNEGMSVVFITHKLREVMSACDRITVLREGQTVLTLDQADASPERLVKAMVGEAIDIENSLLFSQESDQTGSLTTTMKTESSMNAVNAIDAPPGQTPILQMERVTVSSHSQRPLLNNCSLTVQAGEIVGIAGVSGNGQQALAESLMGLQAIATGRVMIDGEDVTHKPTVKRLEQWISYVPEDRLQDGFLPTATVAQNLILGFHRRVPYSNGRFLDWSAIYQAADRLIREYNIRTLGPEDIGANLSGGNIQRVMIARAFSHPARLLIAYNPTQGLDIPSIDFVYTKLLTRKEQGLGTLLISENLDELLLLSDRIATLYQGEIAGILERKIGKIGFDKYELGRLMSGARDHN